MAYLWIALGSAIGGMSRYALSSLVHTRLPDTFPFGTMLVNVFGCFLIGFVAVCAAIPGREPMSPGMVQFLTVGIFGGFTTFSTFSLQSLLLMKDGEWLYASGNIIGTLLLCLLGVWGGFVLASKVVL